MPSSITITAAVDSITYGSHKQQGATLTKNLEDRGYVVQEGAYEYLTPDRCREMPTCYGNNPSSPYGIVFLPAGPHEDTSTYSSWGRLLNMTVNGVRMSSNFRLDTNETVIILGQAPPRCLYYSYVPYVFDRWYPYKWTSPSWNLLGKCDAVTDREGSRCELFASLGDPINMLTMNTSNENGQSFSSAFAHFMGGDSEQIMNLSSIANMHAGIPHAIQNVLPLSTARVKLGLMGTRYCLITT